MSAGPLRVGIVGAGYISTEYLRSLATFPDVSVVGIADLDEARARTVADEHGVPFAGGVDALLAHDDVELVLNLTIPAAHAGVARRALAAGKHVYGEKPLALDPADGAAVLEDAAARGLRVGSAPDTFLGPGIQSARRAIDAGVIGTPVAAMTMVMNPGPERWHPSPEFLFAHGAGPLFDLGPYYVTALVALLGRVERVAASARKGRAERVIGSGPKAGTAFAVEVPTHVTALLEVAGASVASTFSFDSPVQRIEFEVIGTEGTLAVPDPNTFGGPLRVRAAGDEEWRELPVEGVVTERGIGVLELARALRADVPHRASGELAGHVLDVMAAVIGSAEAGEFRTVPPRAAEPAPLPADFDPREPTLG